MAAPTGTNLTYGGVGIREELSDTIYKLFPMETYFLSNAESQTVGNTLVEWQIDELAAAAANSAVEGDDFTAGSAAQPTRLRNQTQISTKTVVVSGTFDAVNKAGRDREITMQTVKRGLELKRDQEFTLLRNQASTAGAGASARLSAGMETWIYSTQHIKATGITTSTTPPPASGYANVAPTDGTTAASFVEANLASALEQGWINGGEQGLILMGSKMKKQFDTFSGVATRFRDVASKSQAQIIGAADVYVSSYGSHRVVLSRYMRPGVIFCLDMKYWGVGYLPGRKMKKIDVAVTGDSYKAMMLSEYTLIAKNPLASTKLAIYA